jgi:hypothetical protein
MINLMPLCPSWSRVLFSFMLTGVWVGLMVIQCSKLIASFTTQGKESGGHTKPSQLCGHANLLFGPIHFIVHWLPNKRFAWPQSCKGFVNMARLQAKAQVPSARPGVWAATHIVIINSNATCMFSVHTCRPNVMLQITCGNRCEITMACPLKLTRQWHSIPSQKHFPFLRSCSSNSFKPIAYYSTRLRGTVCATS